ncbi:MAG: hypothetical protein ACOC7Y_00725 [Chloroflexota bacterium]
MASLILSKHRAESVHLWALLGALVLSVATFIFVCVLKGSGGATAVLGPAQPSSLTGAVVRFHLEPTLWPLALGLALGACSLYLTELGRNSSPRPRLVAVSLGLLAVGLSAIWSATPFTMIVTWALSDLLLFPGLLIDGAGRGTSVRALAFGAASTLLLWAGALAAGDGMGNVQWPLIPPGGVKMTIWMVAALLRIGAYPLHLSALTRTGSTSPLAAILLLSPVIGWGLWIRLAVVNGGTPPAATWVAVVALLTVTAGGLLAWTARRSRDARPFIAMGANGVVLLSSTWIALSGGGQGTAGGVPLAVVPLGVVGWLLGTVVLFLGSGVPWHRIFQRRALVTSVPSLIGALSLSGVPLTLGFVAESYVLSGEPWGPRLAFFAGRVFLVAALGRWLLEPPPLEEDVALPRQVSLAAGAIAPAFFLVLTGLAPALVLSGVPGLSLADLFAGQSLISWLLWVVSVLLGGVLVWQDVVIRKDGSRMLAAVHNLVLLDWTYRLLSGAVEHGLAVIRTLDEILGGRGALLWSLILFLVLVLAWRVS